MREDRLGFHSHPMRAFCPMLLAFETDGLGAPDDLLLFQCFVVDRDSERGPTGIEIKGTADIYIKREFVSASLRDRKRVRGLAAAPGVYVTTAFTFAIGRVRAGGAVAAWAFVTKVTGGRDSFDGHPREARHGLVHDFLGGLEVFFEQQRGNRQHFAKVVEAVAGIVGREFHFAGKLDPHEVANGVAVLDPIEPPHGHLAGIGIRRVDPEGLVFDPLFEAFDLLRRGTRPVIGRHDTGTDVLQSGEPKAGLSDQLRVGLEPIEGDFTLP